MVILNLAKPIALEEGEETPTNLGHMCDVADEVPKPRHDGAHVTTRSHEPFHSNCEGDSTGASDGVRRGQTPTAGIAGLPIVQIHCALVCI